MNTRFAHIGLALMLTPPSVAVAQNHAFTVRDDIEMSRFSDPSAEEKGSSAKLSPDGKYFAVVTSKGLLDEDKIESAILLFDSQTALRSLRNTGRASDVRPRILAKIAAVPDKQASHAYAAVITSLRWSLDSRYLYFIGEDSGRNYRLSVVEIETGRLRVLSLPGYNVTRFDIANGTLVYTAWRAGDGDQNDHYWGLPVNADARSVTGVSLVNALFPYDVGDNTAKKSELWMVRGAKNGGLSRSVARFPSPDLNYMSGVEAFHLSPSGHKLVQLVPVPAEQVSPLWEAYEPALGLEHMQIRHSDPLLTSPNSLVRLKQYELINLDTGAISPLIEAPHALTLGYADGSEVLWSPDERMVLLTNTFLPFEGADSQEQTARRRPCAVASVEVVSRRVDCVVFNSDRASINANGAHLRQASFGTSNDQVILSFTRSDGKEETRRYRYKEGEWSLLDSTGPPSPDLARPNQPTKSQEFEVAVKQSLNEPPTLWATDRRTGRSRRLWDPNPQLARMRFGIASIYRWKDNTGLEWRGGLVMPVDYVQGRRYPLVIQIYSFQDDQFVTDGMMPTSFAARALASAGMMVLQIQRKMPHTLNDAEAQTHLEAFRSAIDHLSAEGLVDPAKVGIVGFSWTCWYVENALIKDPGRFAAATIADGTDHSYMSYHLWGVSSPSIEEQDARINGGKPFGEGLQLWVNMAPGFHLDHVQTPIRIEAIRPSGLLGEWEIYSSLMLQGKPVDLIYFPEGQHIHQRPLERLASQQGNVDWFRFWLQRYEDPDPAKSDQYRRWEALRPEIATK
jgi:dipeptidyl aminopeptidase/acylaminoacyl peptidase